MHLTYRWRATLVIAPGLLMSVLDITIVSVVLPQIATALHADYQTSTWIGTGYLLANAAVIPITGYISGRVGSKTIFLLVLGIFTLGSALIACAVCAVATIFVGRDPALEAVKAAKSRGEKVGESAPMTVTP